MSYINEHYNNILNKYAQLANEALANTIINRATQLQTFVIEMARILMGTITPEQNRALNSYSVSIMNLKKQIETQFPEYRTDEKLKKTFDVLTWTYNQITQIIRSNKITGY